jgi:hypothetical protein
MNSADEYEAWRREAYQQLIDLNEKVNATYGVTAWERFEYDLGAGTLTFSHKGKPRVRADIQLVGAVDRNWLWGWANAGWWPESVLEDSRKVRAFGQQFGIEELTAPRLEAPDYDELGWTMAAVAARVTGALGAYRPVDGPRSMFLLYRSLTLLD